jgi:predicted permease
MLWKPKRHDEDFRDEIEAHVELEADRLVEEEGLERTQALDAARRAFGNMTSSRERFYWARRWMWLDLFARDVRYAARRLRRSPVSSLTVVLSLALGIGATTAIFSLADQALIRALPVAAPERLVQLQWNGAFMGNGMGSVGTGHLVPYLLHRELRTENDVFEDMFARSPADIHLTVGDTSEPVTAEIVTGSYFPTLGVRPVLGRLLTDDDDRVPDAHPVVVLSHDYWRSRFGADPNVVGAQVRVNDFPMTVVGVAEQGFRGMDWGAVPALWVPVMMKSKVTPGMGGLVERRGRFLHVFGRLKAGVSREQAQARLQPWFKAYLAADTEREGWLGGTEQQMHRYMGSSLDLLPAASGPSHLSWEIEQPVLILLAASAMILLLACLNVANVSLARALAARRATAMRVALGASRRRVATAHFFESALLAAAGCAVGCLLAPSVSHVLLSYLPQQGAGAVALSADLDLRVLAFALTAAAITTLVSGSAPALYAASIGPMEALKRQSSSVTAGLGLRRALVIGQFALALVLLIGAGLFARTLATLRAQGPGFPTTNLVMFGVEPLSDGYDVDEAKPAIRRILAELRALPDVERAGVGLCEMLAGGGWDSAVTLVEADRRSVTEDMGLNAVSPGYFETLGVRVTRGRDFAEHDARDDSDFAPRSAIVNEEFVRRYLSEVEPLGARVGFGDEPSTVADIEVVGVVTTFQDFGLRGPEPQVFVPLWEDSAGEGTFYVRTRGSSLEVARSVRAAVDRVDPKLTILSPRTIDDQLDRLLTKERMLTTLAVAFAAVATLLAMIGLYGVLSFSAASRTKEVGIRLALGATRWDAMWLVVREAATLVAIAIVIALPAIWALGRLVESQLFGVSPLDLATIVGAAAVLAFVCLGASAIPARRAGLVDPLDALRSE